MIDVVWLNLEPVPLDHFMLKDMFNGVMWEPINGYDFNIVRDFDEANNEGAVVVIPGGYVPISVDEINEHISKYEWVLIIIASDESNLFDVQALDHPNYKLWVQTPRAGVDYGDARLFGVGYARAHDYVSDYHRQSANKKTDVFISAQNTHPRRNYIFGQVYKYAYQHKDLAIKIHETKGFTRGYKPKRYYEEMSSAKVIPCPSGIVSPDSFRVYEALESGSIPIPDDVSPSYDSKGYWDMIFPDAPFKILRGDNIAKIIDEALENYDALSNQVFAWWIGKKREYVYNLHEDIESLSGITTHRSLKSRISVMIPVSPWKSHPSTYILDETIRNVRAHLPDSEIIITFDGVREEQTDMTDDYNGFIREMLWKINNLPEYRNILPLVFDEHSHQVKMARAGLKHIKTRSFLYLEGDSPLYPDRRINWDGILTEIENDDARIVRLYNKEFIPPEHEYLMEYERNKEIDGDELIGTQQWSQQPHIANTKVYEQMLDQHFSPDAIGFIEDHIYYIVVGDCVNGNWDKWKMFIWLPFDEEPRSYHLDGRSGGEKFDDKQTF